MNEAETSSLWLLFMEYTQREKYLCLEFFWSVFSCIWNELQIYSVNTRIQSTCRKTQTRKSPNTDNFHLVIIIPSCIVFIFTQHAITHVLCRISLHCIFFLLDKQKSWRWAKGFSPKRNKMKKDSEIDEKKNVALLFCHLTCTFSLSICHPIYPIGQPSLPMSIIINFVQKIRQPLFIYPLAIYHKSHCSFICSIYMHRLKR